MSVLLLAVGAAEAERVEGETDPLPAGADDVDAAGRAFAVDEAAALADGGSELVGYLPNGGVFVAEPDQVAA